MIDLRERKITPPPASHMQTTTITLTKAEQELLYEMVKTHITWREGGCLIKNDGELSKPKMKMAEAILKKI